MRGLILKKWSSLIPTILARVMSHSFYRRSLYRRNVTGQWDSSWAWISGRLVRPQSRVGVEPVFLPAHTWLHDQRYTSWPTWNREITSRSRPTKMTESSANKLLNGDACHRTSNGRKSSKNGFVKNHCLFQQPQKYRRPRERKVRPNRQLLDMGGP